MSKGFASSYRIVILAVGLFACFGGVAVRLVWLHVIDREALVKTIARTRQQMIVERAKRGDIRDRNGAILATSHSQVVLGVDPTVVRPADLKELPKLAAMLGVPEKELRRLFLTKYGEPMAARPVVAVGLPEGAVVFKRDNLVRVGAPVDPVVAEAPGVARPLAAAAVGAGDFDQDLDPVPDEEGRRVIRWAKISEGVSEELAAMVLKLGLKCLTTDRVFRRVYPNNQLAAHVLGYVNRQQEPAAGVESYADFYLRGQNGWRVGERDGRNRELAQFNTRKVPPSDGYTVFLTIDTVVQDLVEQELAQIARKYEPLKASIIVSDPRSGFILGMANYPSFNLNEYNSVPKEETGRMRNVAITDVYEPGSVFKIVAAAGALEEKLAKAETTFDCAIDRIDYNGRVRKLPREDHNFGRLTVAEIIAHSSNRGAAQLAMALGDDRFYNYVLAFGFGRRLGFPVGGEQAGTVHPPKRWDGLTITRMPMGQSVACTVLQMHQAMSVLAADGVLLRPQIIRQIRDASLDMVYRYDRDEIGRAVSVKTAQTMARLLMAVATKEGTAPEAAIAGFDVAGKTGTAQKYVDGKPSNRHHIASFVGFFPAGRPQVVISVIVDDADHKAPGGVAYGSKVAAPSFKRIGERLIPILNIQASGQVTRPTVLAQAGVSR